MTDQPPQPSPASTPISTADKPSALACFDAFAAMLGDRRPAVFLDYDGTLTPIVERPDLAVLDESVRAVIRRLSGLCPVAVVSGRDLEDVARHVGIGELIYAGSHGFDIRGPGLRTQIGEEYLGDLDQAQADLSRRLDRVEGVLVERKRFAIAVHTRRVAPDRKAAVGEAVQGVAASLPKLRVTGGKEIHELRPDLPWDKGRAVLSLLDRLGLAGPETLPLYLGDDETDEDAFRALAARGEGRGAGIRVMDPPAPSAAGWSLKTPAEAGVFLDRLAGWLADG